MTRVDPHPGQLAHAELLIDHFEKLEAQFQLLRDGLTHSHRLATLGTIASMVAHEYNNILTPIISYAQLALQRPNDRDLLIRAVEKALAGAERAASISSSMLGFARESDPETVADVRGAIDEAVACLGRAPARDGIELTVDVPAVRVQMSPLNLQQVFVNLILNARQAMAGGRGSIRISGRVASNDVHIDVADTGPGIPPAILGRIFEPFVTQRRGEGPGVSGQADGEEQGVGRGDQAGTGLGLCICRDLIQAARGEIRVTSPPGQGATFHLRLPLAEEFETT